MTDPHLDRDDVVTRLEGMPALPPIAQAMIPGAIAGQPTPFDVIAKTLVALRTQVEGVVVSATAALDQIEVVSTALWLSTPPEIRGQVGAILAGADRGTVATAPAEPPAGSAGEGAGTERTRPRTFMDKGNNREG